MKKVCRIRGRPLWGGGSCCAGAQLVLRGLLDDDSAVDVPDLAGDEAGFIAGEEDDSGGNFVWFTDSTQDRHTCHCSFGILTASGHVVHSFGPDWARGDGVDADFLRGEPRRRRFEQECLLRLW